MSEDWWVKTTLFRLDNSNPNSMLMGGKGYSLVKWNVCVHVQLTANANNTHCFIFIKSRPVDRVNTGFWGLPPTIQQESDHHHFVPKVR